MLHCWASAKPLWLQGFNDQVLKEMYGEDRCFCFFFEDINVFATTCVCLAENTHFIAGLEP